MKIKELSKLLKSKKVIVSSIAFITVLILGYKIATNFNGEFKPVVSLNVSGNSTIIKYDNDSKELTLNEGDTFYLQDSSGSITKMEYNKFIEDCNGVISIKRNLVGSILYTRQVVESNTEKVENPSKINLTYEGNKIVIGKIGTAPRVDSIYVNLDTGEISESKKDESFEIKLESNETITIEIPSTAKFKVETFLPNLFSELDKVYSK